MTWANRMNPWSVRLRRRTRVLVLPFDVEQVPEAHPVERPLRPRSGRQGSPQIAVGGIEIQDEVPWVESDRLTDDRLGGPAGAI